MATVKGTDKKISEGSIDSTSIITQAYLNVTQSITQGLFSNQLVEIKCAKNNRWCNTCMETSKKYNLATSDFSQACPECFCHLTNVTMKSIITLNLSSELFTSASANFANNIKNAVTSSAIFSGTDLFGLNKSKFTDDNKNSVTGSQKLSDIGTKIHTLMSQENFQKSLQVLKTFQILSIKNPNTDVINVNLSLATKFISNIIQDSDAVMDQSVNLQTTVDTLTKQEVNSAFTVLITYIVTLAMIFIIVFAFGFAINMIMELLVLYSGT